jgi:hypothetical protein
MRALVLDGTAGGEASAGLVLEALGDLLGRRGWEVDAIALRQAKIAPCRSCFGCWVRTPGECVIEDEGREVARRFIGSHLAVLLSPVTFGGYSFELKKALDRMICLIHGLFCRRAGVTRHPPRYPAYPGLLGVGLLSEAEQQAEALFGRLIESNSHNFYAPAWAAAFVYDGSGREQARVSLSLALERLGTGPAVAAPPAAPADVTSEGSAS